MIENIETVNKNTKMETNNQEDGDIKYGVEIKYAQGIDRSLPRYNFKPHCRRNDDIQNLADPPDDHPIVEREIDEETVNILAYPPDHQCIENFIEIMTMLELWEMKEREEYTPVRENVVVKRRRSTKIESLMKCISLETYPRKLEH